VDGRPKEQNLLFMCSLYEHLQDTYTIIL